MYVVRGSGDNYVYLIVEFVIKEKGMEVIQVICCEERKEKGEFEILKLLRLNNIFNFF